MFRFLPFGRWMQKYSLGDASFLVCFLRYFSKMRNFRQNEMGEVAIEYGLIAAFVAISVIAVLPIIGTQVEDFIKAVISSLKDYV